MCAKESQAATICSYRLGRRFRQTQEAVLTASAAQLRARLTPADSLDARVPMVTGVVVNTVRTRRPSPQQVMGTAATREFEEYFVRQEFRAACHV